MSDRAAEPSALSRSPMPVPPLLQDAAGWAWRLLILAAASYLLVQFMDRLALIVLPVFAALFASCLAYPLTRWLQSHHVKRALATWITVLLAALVFGAITIFVVNRAVAEYPDFVTQVQATVTHFRNFLTNDLHVKASSTEKINTTISNYLKAHQTSVASNALSGIATISEGLGSLVLWFFITFFLLYDGDNIWAWVVDLFPESAHDRVVGAGQQAWNRLAGFVRGTFIIALVHAIVAAVTLSILRVPLVAPLAMLVFIGSFLPIIGSIIFGALAVGIALVTKGHVAGIILAIVLIADNQLEAHVLQPFLVGRYVRLHPLAVAISIAGGAVLEGIPGAVIAVPFVAVVYAVAKFLATGELDRPPPTVNEDEGEPDEAHEPGAEADAAPA